MLLEHEIEIRVRYQETDAQRRVHHANYINYFEVGRVELLRAAGYNYKQLEADGLLLVVTHLNCEYFLPAEYDDLLTVRTRTARVRAVRIHHQYEISRGADLIARGSSIVACVDQQGKPRKLPEFLRHPPLPPAD